jgi:hypothetical protein
MVMGFSRFGFHLARACFMIIALVAGVADFGHSQQQIGNDNTKPKTLQQIQDCSSSRPLNPTAQNLNSKQGDIENLDSAFTNAFAAAGGGQFQAAVFYYKMAFRLANCSCDKNHAAAGIIAASAAGSLMEQEGWRARPSQAFWSQLKYLTRGFKCVKVN